MYFQNCNSKNFLKFAASPEKLQKTDLNKRNKYNNNSKIFSKIEKRFKSKVRAMKFRNQFENKVYFDVQSSNRFRLVNLLSLDTKRIREFGSRKSGHQLRSSGCKVYNWLVLAQNDRKYISLRTLIVIKPDYHQFFGKRPKTNDNRV